MINFKSFLFEGSRGFQRAKRKIMSKKFGADSRSYTALSDIYTSQSNRSEFRDYTKEIKRVVDSTPAERESKPYNPAASDTTMNKGSELRRLIRQKYKPVEDRISREDVYGTVKHEDLPHMQATYVKYHDVYPRTRLMLTPGLYQSNKKALEYARKNLGDNFARDLGSAIRAKYYDTISPKEIIKWRQHFKKR
jgi:hypothetical protein